MMAETKQILTANLFDDLRVISWFNNKRTVGFSKNSLIFLDLPVPRWFRMPAGPQVSCCSR